jgi:alpha-tubulin suppressor-like RCC1 family protein
LICDAEKNNYFLDAPKRVRGIIENVNIIQIAAGESHTLALSDKGEVFAWGYTNFG